MALLGCYLDDSRDQDDKVLIAVAGFYGWCLDFFDVETKWQQCLRRHGLKYFHATECESLNGQFYRFRRKKGRHSPEEWEECRAAAAKVRSELIAVLNESPLEGIGMALAFRDYRRVRRTEKGAAQILQLKPFYFCYHQLMIDLVRQAEPRFKGHVIGFVCDQYPKQSEAERAFSSLKQKNPSSARMIASIAHDDDKAVPPLQMADLLAHETRLAKLARMRGKDPLGRNSLYELAPSVFTFKDITEVYLREVVHELRGRGRSRRAS